MDRCEYFRENEREEKIYLFAVIVMKHETMISEFRKIMCLVTKKRN